MHINGLERAASVVQVSGRSTGTHRLMARTQSFTVECVSGTAGDQFSFAAASEIILLIPEAGVTVDSAVQSRTIDGHSIVILSPGDFLLSLDVPGVAYILSTDRTDVSPEDAVNASSYASPDPRVPALGPPLRSRRGAEQIRVYPVEQVTIPPDNGRLRFLQSATMSINWVEYEGERGRNALSPHSHADFEQASLAIVGNYVHHVRTPWGPDADQWRDDAHLEAGPGTLLVVPPDIIHTTEGVGDGRHILIDIFAPPRRDFIQKNWVFNAGDYAPAEEAAQ